MHKAWAVVVASAGLLVVVPGAARAQNPLEMMRGAGDAARQQLEERVNAKLLEESRKNQCSFKTGTDELMPGCDAKLRNLVSSLVEAKRQLDAAGVRNYRFEVGGHTDTTGNAEANQKLSEKRAKTIAQELTARGIAEREVTARGYGATQPRVKPDNTPAKKAQNRRYEIQVRL